MKDIPQDVKEAAKRVEEQWLPPRAVRDASIDSLDMKELSASVRRLLEQAILAERVRSAGVCFRLAGGDDFRDDDHSLEAACGRAILAGEQP